jgi:hypothetical protein
VIPPNFPTILGKAVPTMVVSRAANAMPSIRAMVTIIFVFLVIDVRLSQGKGVGKNYTINQTRQEE